MDKLLDISLILKVHTGNVMLRIYCKIFFKNVIIKRGRLMIFSRGGGIIEILRAKRGEFFYHPPPEFLHGIWSFSCQNLEQSEGRGGGVTWQMY